MRAYEISAKRLDKGGELTSLNQWFLRITVLLSAFFLLYDAENFGHGVQNAMMLCYRSVIPSLYPFCILCLFTIYTGIFFNWRPCNFLSKILFGLDGDVGCVSLMSLICGYPVGAKMIDGLYKDGKITKIGAQTLLMHCVNPGPAFLLTMIGKGIYGSEMLGGILLVSELAAAGITARIHKRKITAAVIKSSGQKSQNGKEACIRAVNDSGESILKICFWVLLFGGVSAVIQRSGYLMPLSCILEVTIGVYNAKDYSPYLVAFLIGFGGLSVQLQVVSVAKDYLKKPMMLIFWKTVQGAICAAVTWFLVTLVKPSLSVWNTVKISESHGNPYLSAIMLIGFVLSTFLFLHSGIHGKRKLPGCLRLAKKHKIC